MMKPAKVVTDELRKKGYIARQNRKNVSLNLNLGGIRSEINGDFKGLVLLNPAKNIVFGASANKLLEFRKIVMKKTGNYEWERLVAVPGPPNDLNKVTVDFSSGEVAQTIFCKVKGMEPIGINGYAEKLNYDPEAGYDWNDIELFLKNLSVFCAQSYDTLPKDNNYLPCKEDVDAAELQVRKTTSGEVIDLDAVLDQVKTDFEKAGKSIKENWREITKHKIPIWFGKNMGGSDAA